MLMDPGKGGAFIGGPTGPLLPFSNLDQFKDRPTFTGATLQHVASHPALAEFERELQCIIQCKCKQMDVINCGMRICSEYQYTIFTVIVHHV